MTAPVTVIIAYDLKFYDKLPELYPHNLAMRDVFANNPQLVEVTAKRNSSLQGAYLMLAARALGLDCGPMSGFDNARVDEEFFAAGRCEDCEQEFFPEGHVKSNFLCNLGYGDRSKLYPRSPRLEFTRHVRCCELTRWTVVVLFHVHSKVVDPHYLVLWEFSMQARNSIDVSTASTSALL